VSTLDSERRKIWLLWIAFFAYIVIFVILLAAMFQHVSKVPYQVLVFAGLMNFFVVAIFLLAMRRPYRALRDQARRDQLHEPQRSL